MLIVTEQHRIDLTDRILGQCRPGKLLQLHMGQLIGPRRIEGRIGEQAEAVDLNQGGRAADQRECE